MSELDDIVANGGGGEEVDSSDDEEPQQQEEGGGEDGEARSALEDSIRRKGRHSYYYAHKKRLDAPSWDGNAAPRLLAKETLAVTEAVPSEPIRSFAWNDENEKIKIYVTLPDLKEEEEGASEITLTHTPTSLTLTIKATTKHHTLHLHRLYNEIHTATYRRKGEKITLTLTKKEGMTAPWFDLKKAA